MNGYLFLTSEIYNNKTFKDHFEKINEFLDKNSSPSNGIHYYKVSENEVIVSFELANELSFGKHDLISEIFYIIKKNYKNEFSCQISYGIESENKETGIWFSDSASADSERWFSIANQELKPVRKTSLKNKIGDL